MNKFEHLIIETIVFLILWGFFESITITMIIIPIFWGTAFPDFDHQVRSHRNVIFHSIVPNLAIWLFDMSLTNVLLVLAVGIHLICDLLPALRKGKSGGYACIDLWLFRWGSITSRLWLLMNFIGSVLLFWWMI